MRFVWIALTISVAVATIKVEEGKGEIVEKVGFFLSIARISISATKS